MISEHSSDVGPNGLTFVKDVFAIAWLSKVLH